MGNWAVDHVDALTSEQCKELQSILNEETLDLVNMLLKRETVPDHLNNSVMKSILDWKDQGNITGYAK